MTTPPARRTRPEDPFGAADVDDVPTACSRSRRRSGLPLAVRGIASTTRVARGSFGPLSRSRPNVRSSSTDGADAPGRGTTNATTSSPHSSSGTPTTHTSSTSGWCASTPSTSVGLTLTPPVMTRSLSRSTTCTRPASSIVPTSPVWNQPSASSTARGAGRVEPVAAHHHRPRTRISSSAREPHLGAAIGTPSSAKPPHVSESPYASTTRDAARPRRAPAARAGTARRR